MAGVQLPQRLGMALGEQFKTFSNAVVVCRTWNTGHGDVILVIWLGSMRMVPLRRGSPARPTAPCRRQARFTRSRRTRASCPVSR